MSQTLGCAIQGNDLTIDQTKTDQLLSAMKNLGKTVVPIGSVVFYLGTSIPDGYLLCNGASLLRTEYPELFEVLGTKCGSVDSAHFTLPDTHHRFLEGTTTLSEVGSYVEAGLPNIAGHASWNRGCYDIASMSGSLSVRKYGTSRTENMNDLQPGDLSIGLDASKSSSLYGSSTTVQVSALFGQHLIRYC